VGCLLTLEAWREPTCVARHFDFAQGRWSDPSHRDAVRLSLTTSLIASAIASGLCRCIK
jgi:hypothetical protein